jgi:excisionase family DNA binding protein
MTAPSDIEKPLLCGVQDAARQLGLGKSTVWSLIAQGQLEAVRIGRRTLIKHSSMCRLAERGTQSSGGKNPGVASGGRPYGVRQRNAALNSIEDDKGDQNGK